MTQTAIEIKHLNRIFKLDSVEVVACMMLIYPFPRPIFLALMGLRVGQITLLNIISGLDQPTWALCGSGCRDAAHERKRVGRMASSRRRFRFSDFQSDSCADGFRERGVAVAPDKAEEGAAAPRRDGFEAGRPIRTAHNYTAPVIGGNSNASPLREPS